MKRKQIPVQIAADKKRGKSLSIHTANGILMRRRLQVTFDVASSLRSGDAALLHQDTGPEGTFATAETLIFSNLPTLRFPDARTLHQITAGFCELGLRQPPVFNPDINFGLSCDTLFSNLIC